MGDWSARDSAAVNGAAAGGAGSNVIELAAVARPMNAYGELARDLWRAADAARFASMPRREQFFAELGESVAHRVADLLEIFAVDAPTGETERHRAVRLRRARKDAEEIAYQELIFSQSVASETDDYQEYRQA